MKILKRLNAVTAAEKMDFDTFFGIMKKHKNDAIKKARAEMEKALDKWSKE